MPYKLLKIPEVGNSVFKLCPDLHSLAVTDRKVKHVVLCRNVGKTLDNSPSRLAVVTELD